MASVLFPKTQAKAVFLVHPDAESDKSGSEQPVTKKSTLPTALASAPAKEYDRMTRNRLTTVLTVVVCIAAGIR